VPLLEMIGRRPPPSAERREAARVAYVEAATRDAWAVRDVVMGDRGDKEAPLPEELRSAAFMTRSWATQCSPDLSFTDIFPSLLGVASATGPRLHPDVAERMWRVVGASACARKLSESDRQWLVLFEATARRDAARMAQTAIEILRHRPGERNAASEYAFLAASTALIAQGDSPRAAQLVDVGLANWVRPGEHETELRYLAAAINAAAKRSP
jgi:hypothetical protein